MKTLDSLVERFEQAVAEYGVESVAPPDIVTAWESETDTQVHSEAITELLRVWLEYRFASQLPVTRQEATSLFPNIAFSDFELQSLDFEFQRLSANTSASESARCSANRATAELPDLGETWGDFLLLEQLGEGAFARVYLARQISMAGRLVALKLTFRVTLESQLLARLHHSAIVPIYSMHQHDEIYGLCMPYLGNTTLLDLLKEILPTGAKNFGSIDSADGIGLLEILVHRQARITTIAKHASDQETQDRESTWVGVKPGTDSERAPKSSQSEFIQPDHADSGALQTSSASKQNRATAKELSKLDYVGAITWIGAQLADALDHAHRHGVLHCDIKPANVLLAPDGQARLLDFNVSLEQRNTNDEMRVGGTMAYMSPEQFVAVQGAGQPQIDERSDIYSLGVVLFEMLAGVVPKQHASDEQVQVRQKLQKANPSVTPAVAAIIQKCLANEPQARYASAALLYEDLNAQCNSLPLVHLPEPSLIERTHKWVRRHPLLTSVSSISLTAACLVAVTTGAFLWRGQQLERLERIGRGDRLQQLVPSAIATVSAMRNYPELTNEALTQTNQVFELLRDEPGQPPDLSILADLAPLQTLVRLSKRNGLDRHVTGMGDLTRKPLADGKAVQGATPLEMEAFAAEITRLEAALQNAYPSEPVNNSHDELLEAYLDGRFADVLELGKKLPTARASDYATWMFLGQSNLKVGNFAAARECFSVCVTLRPSIEVAWFYRGIARLESSKFELAIGDFSKAIAINSNFPAARYNLALAYEALGEIETALDTLDAAIADGWQSVSGYAFRAKLNQQLGYQTQAKQDLALAIASRPTTELDWVRRGTLLLPTDPNAAKIDFEQAISLNPQSISGRQNLAHVLAERLSQPEASLEHLNALVELDATNAERWAGRGVVLARLGRLSDALRDLSHASTLSMSNPLVAYQVACGYSLVASQMSGNTAEKEASQPGFPTQSQILSAALKWYTYSVKSRPDIAEIAKTDTDVAWLRIQPQFEEANQTVNLSESP
ncbi:MAG: protein kinase [Pirellulaceae bacterium]